MAGGVDPLGWWNLLQSNFLQIAEAAAGASADSPAKPAAVKGKAATGETGPASGVRRRRGKAAKPSKDVSAAAQRTAATRRGKSGGA
jgi:hypothetical protein